VAVAAAWSVLLQGCYRSLPLQQGVAPETGRVELVLNDQGRAALSERLGPMVEKVEGQMLSQTTESYTVSVVRISQLNGGTALWNGEQVTIPKSQLLGYQVRQLDKVKTFGLAAAVTVAMVVLFLGKSLTGGGTDDKQQPPDPGQPTRVIR
jgi:hypothetical protein